MKKKLLSLLLTFCLLLPLFPSGQAASGQSTWELLEEAYLYAFPLVLMDATKAVSTNTETPTEKRAPVNQLINTRSLLDSSSRTVVTPNVDTIYTQAWLDVAEEPMLYVLPAADRFFNVQLLDGWTNTIAILEEPGTYAIVRAGWNGTLPEGVTKIEAPTDTVWLIARIVLSGEEDLPNVYAIQEQMQLLPLSAYGQSSYTAPAGTYDPDEDFVPVKHVLGLSAKEFFDIANAQMVTNPPAAADAELLQKLAAIHVGPGETFDESVLGLGGTLRWKLMLLQMRSKLTQQAGRYAQKLGQWTYYGDPIGNFGTEYTYRTMVALAGLGANPTEVAIYPKTGTDDQGNTLTGKNTYVLHFDTFPPTIENGFWSVTAYGEDDFLIDNPIGRYCINDRSDLKRNADGSVDIILSKEPPEETANWLPVGEGEFHLFLRIYKPDWASLQDWQPPTVSLR